MKLSIITINYNNAEGLKKTMKSVISQSSLDFEYIIIDGGSTDSSCNVISDLFLLDSVQKNGNLKVNGISTKWISEKDEGIYDAMNKGIKLAKGEYVQFINSSDFFVNDTVVSRMLLELKQYKLINDLNIDILYGNMLKMISGKIKKDCSFKGNEITFLDMYNATLNHSPVFIKKSLFDIYGLYDSSLKIVSDWKWYTQAIILGGIKPIYVDIDVIYFDMTGISSVNLEMTENEKQSELKKMFPELILKDYERWSFPIEQFKRLERYKWAYKFVWYLERTLFKYEKFVNQKQNFKVKY